MAVGLLAGPGAAHATNMRVNITVESSYTLF